MCALSNIYISMSDDGERYLAKHVKTIKKCMLIWQIQIISSSIDSTYNTTKLPRERQPLL
jgi:hypothetical protein